MSTRRLFAALLLAALGACVDDPIGTDPDLGSDASSSADLLPIDLITLDAPPVPTLEWLPSRSGITGLQNTGVVVDGERFLIGGSDGVYSLVVNEDNAHFLLAVPKITGFYNLVGVDASRPLIVADGALLRASTPSGWETLATGLPSNLPANGFVATASRYYVLMGGGAIWGADTATTPSVFTQVKPPALNYGIAYRADKSIWIAKGVANVVLFNEATGNDTTITTTDAFESYAVHTGSRTLIGGSHAAQAKVFVSNGTETSTTQCGLAIANETSVIAVFSAANSNFAATETAVYRIAADCTGEWSKLATYSGTLMSFAWALAASSLEVIAIATDATVFRRASDTGVTTEFPIDSAAVATTSVTANPTNQNHLVLGTAGRGLWESHNHGETWTRLAPTVFAGNVYTTVRFTAPDTLLVTAAANAVGPKQGGVFRGVYSNDAWTFTRIGAAGQNAPPQDALASALSPTLGIVTCFNDVNAPLRYSTGNDWRIMPEIGNALECLAVASSDDGAVHWVGGAGTIAVLYGTSANALTVETPSLPNIGIVSAITSVGGNPARAIVTTDEGTFLLVGSEISEIRFGGLALGAASAAYREPLRNGRQRLWLASTIEPLLVSDDEGDTWQRVPTISGTKTPSRIAGLFRDEETLFAATFGSSLWHATLP